jgi:uncharacterized membrane protein (Fun14 family)
VLGDDKDKNKFEIKLPDIPKIEIPKVPDSIQFDMDDVLNNVGPYVTTVSFGGLTGYCSGFILKKTTRAAAGIFGAMFCLFQVKE